VVITASAGTIAQLGDREVEHLVEVDAGPRRVRHADRRARRRRQRGVELAARCGAGLLLLGRGALGEGDADAVEKVGHGGLLGGGARWKGDGE